MARRGGVHGAGSTSLGALGQTAWWARFALACSSVLGGIRFGLRRVRWAPARETTVDERRPPPFWCLSVYGVPARFSSPGQSRQCGAAHLGISVVGLSVRPPLPVDGGCRR